MLKPYLDCVLCGVPLDGEDAAICQSLARGVGHWGWVEFVNDLRTSDCGLIHPTCFANTYGVERLIELVRERDRLNRGVVPELMMEIAALRRQLPDSN